MRTIQDILNTRGMQVLGVEPSATVREAVKWMVQAGVGCVIVGRPPDLLGIFTERDLAVRVVAAGRDPDTTLIQDVMSLPVRSCPPTATVADVARTFAGSRVRHLAVLDEGDVVGVISLRDVLPAEASAPATV